MDAGRAAQHLGLGATPPAAHAAVAPVWPRAERPQGAHGGAARTCRVCRVDRPPVCKQVHGGFSMAWNDGQVTFVSIRGAGHLAPLYRPAASFTMMRAFLAAEPLPPPFYKYPENSAL